MMLKVNTLAIKPNHFTVTSADYMRQLCADLFSRWGIATFRHVRMFNDGSRIELTTDEEWFVYFMAKGYFNYSRLDRDASCYTSGYFLWDAWNKNNKFFSLVMQDAIHHGGGCGISILRKKRMWVDKFDFSTTHETTGINEFYLTHVDMLNNFIDQYLEKAANLVQQANHEREHLPYSINPYKEYDDTYLPTKILSALGYQNQHNKSLDSNDFTRRELQCLYWLRLGKTVPDIACIFDISFRTVEKYIFSIKEKLGCRTLFQTGEIIGRLKIDLLLQGLDVD